MMCASRQEKSTRKSKTTAGVLGILQTALILSQVGTASGCVGPSLRARLDIVRGDIAVAEEAEAYRCAPRELALAQSNAEFTQIELDEGNFLRADEHLKVSLTNAKLALEKSTPDICPKEGEPQPEPPIVVIKPAEDPPKKPVEEKLNIKVDTDNDTILDEQDVCPQQAEDVDGFEDEDGCPDADNDQDTMIDTVDRCPNKYGPPDNNGCPLGDLDSDGINDKSDLCPSQAEDFDFDRDNDGCPDLDTDGDGIDDDKDACPKDAEDKDGNQDTDGCPDTDNDDDGVTDAMDACPKQAGPVETRGCPDTDGDRIADADDQCPNEVGVLQPENLSKNGCPKKYINVIVKKDRIEIKQQVQFETDSAVIRKESFKLLSEVGDAIRSSELKKVSIYGHTDDVGPDDYNLKLSQSRADAVRQYLIEVENISADMLDAKGFGESKPLVANTNKKNRSQNRRVEFAVER